MRPMVGTTKSSLASGRSGGPATESVLNALTVMRSPRTAEMPIDATGPICSLPAPRTGEVAAGKMNPGPTASPPHVKRYRDVRNDQGAAVSQLAAAQRRGAGE